MASPSTEPTVGAAPVYGITQLSPSATAYPGSYLSISSSAGPLSGSQKEQTFPERPGLPECQYYLRTGDCKFGATCKYHHPPEWSSSKTNYILSPMGLPLRPVSIHDYRQILFGYSLMPACLWTSACISWTVLFISHLTT